MNYSKIVCACTLVVLLSTAIVAGFASAAGTKAPHIPPATPNFTRDYSDPASDVMLLYSSNNTPVIKNGSFVMSPNPGEVNIKELHSGSVDNFTVFVKVVVKGAIASRSNVTYTVNLYTNLTNATRYILKFSNGVTTLTTNKTGAAVKDISGNETISGTTLTINVNTTLFGQIGGWSLDAVASETGSTYTYKDFGWETPGNPGSTPTMIVGTVVDKDGDPVAGVIVKVLPDGPSATTDASGNYILVLTTPGSLTIEASKDGYKTKETDLVASSGQTTTSNIVLQKSGGIPAPGAVEVLAVAALAAGAIAVARRRGK